MQSWGSQTNVPTDLTNLVAVVAGQYNHNLGLQSDGNVVAWGDNTYGQTNVPSGLSNVVAIAAGAGHCLSLRADGTVVAWGYNTSGQCNVPLGLSNVVAVAAGYYHTLALKADGTVVSWGDNSYVQTNVPGGLANGNGSVLGIGTWGGEGRFSTMARKLSVELPGAVYHVMNRGGQSESKRSCASFPVFS